jgi:uncharacterized protein YjbI with pentapeptide repeats
MAPPPRLHPPQISAIVLPDDLAPTAADDVLDGDQREGELYDRVDFGSRDLEHTGFTGCAFRRANLDQARLRGAHFAEVVMTEIDAAGLTASRSSWRNVELTGSRIGAAELYETQWRSVVVTGSKISYLNARSARWQDVIFRDCTVDELDLGGASINRLTFERCQIARLDVRQAKLADVDLRGAELHLVKGLAGLAGSWIDERQLSELAPLLAAELKITVT